MNAAAWTISGIAIGMIIVLAFRWERNSQGREPDHVDDEHRKVEFMSAAWIAMARREITAALARRDLDVEPSTLSEEFTNPPPHLGRGLDTVGFSVRIGDGRVEVLDGPDPRADCRVISDYAEARALAREPSATSNDPAEASRRVAEGRLRIEGDPTRMPAALQELDIHALLASRTA